MTIRKFEGIDLQICVWFYILLLYCLLDKQHAYTTRAMFSVNICRFYELPRLTLLFHEAG